MTAEQILFDAQMHKLETLKLPEQNIQGPEELEAYKLDKRNQFEEAIRRRKHHMGNWFKYANWEERLQEFKRCRSVYERALQVDYQCASLWLKYAEMEMRHKFINHARNV